MTGQSTEPLAIAQALLDKTGKALMSGDATAMAECFSLPMSMGTFNGSVTIETVAQLEERFASVRNHYRQIGVTDLVRHIIAVEQIDADTIHGSHESRLLAGNTLVQNPYTSFSVLKRIGTDWKITFSQYAIADSDKHNSALVGEPNQGDRND